MVEPVIVIFDLDGTIIDSTEAILDAFKAGYKSIQQSYPGDQVIIDMFGKSLEAILNDLRIPQNQQKTFTDEFIFDELKSSKFHIYEGMNLVLDYTKKISGKAVVVTSKSKSTLDRALQVTGLDSFFDVIITSEMVVKAKPDPEPLLLALEKLEITPNVNVVYVGDSKHDMNAAEAAGITPLGVLWGAHGSDLIKPGRLFFETPDQLLEYFKKNLKPAHLKYLELLSTNFRYFKKIAAKYPEFNWYSASEPSSRFERPIDLYYHAFQPIVSQVNLRFPGKLSSNWLTSDNVPTTDFTTSEIVEAYNELLINLKEIRTDNWRIVNLTLSDKWNKVIEHTIMHIGQLIYKIGNSTP